MRSLDANVNRAASRGSNGSLFVGDKGFITTGTYGEGTRLLPAERMQDYKMPLPVRASVSLLRDLLERRLAAELRPEMPLGAVHLLEPLDDVYGHADRPRLVCERTGDAWRIHQVA